MSDFIREVDEEYRRDRAAQFLKKYQVLIAVVVIAILAAAGGWRVWKDNQTATAEKANARYDAAAQLAKDGKDAEAQAAFNGLAADGPKGYAVLSRMRAADVLAAKDPEAAAKAFDAIASDASVGPPMADTARFRGAVLRIDRDDPKAFEQRYARYAQEDFAYRASIGELLALAALKRNDYPAAGRYLDRIIADPNAPSGLRNRATAFRQLVISGPATPIDKQPPPADVAPLDGAPMPKMQPPAAPPAGANPAAGMIPQAGGGAPTSPPPPPPPVAAQPPAAPATGEATKPPPPGEADQ